MFLKEFLKYFLIGILTAITALLITFILIIGYFLGTSIAFSSFVFGNPCAFYNTMYANLLVRAYKPNCLYIFVSDKHVRYGIPINGKYIEVVDVACGKDCDNIKYYIYKICRESRSKAKSYWLGYLTFSEFVKEYGNRYKFIEEYR